MKITPLVLILVTLATLVSCASRPQGPYRTPTAAMRDTARAQELSQRATALIDEDSDAAEDLLREALEADLFFGPAHNNLGVVHLNRGALYDAATEFEWARKLMPGHPDPRLNLAMTLERAGQIGNAVDTYVSALEVYPEHLPTMQALARCQLRYGREDDHTPHLLDVIALRGATEEWRRWARAQTVRIAE